MMVALLAPELIVGWAARQRRAAVEIAERNQMYKWTKTHGFFVVMGGFMEYEDDEPVRTLDDDQPVRTLDNVDKVVDNKAVDDENQLVNNTDQENKIPAEAKERISEREIQDRSKGDVISKGFALLQTGWFILQCISRKMAGLSVTQLEIATVAFAVLNFATYMLWWNKPLSVEAPVRVYRSKYKAGGVKTRERGKDEVGWWAECRKFLTGCKRIVPDFLEEVHRTSKAGFKELKWYQIWGFPFAPFVPILVGTKLGVDEKRVGTFSPALPDEEIYHSPILGIRYSREVLQYLDMLVVGLAFGGIHCIAWKFEFPSSAERLLWRISAISVTGVPLFMTLTGQFAMDNSDKPNYLLRYIAKAQIFLLLAPSFLLYICARLTLLVLPFLALRSLPPDAYRTADWTRFIPHV